MTDTKETALIDSSPTSPAAPARLRARIMASGYRYQMLDGKNMDGFELELREESKANQSVPYLKAIAIVLGLVAMALLVALVFVVARQSREDDFQVCITAECVSTSAAILSRMDTEIHPCKDMYHLACGKWINNTMLPSGFSRLSMLGQISSRNQLKMRKLLESDGMLLGNKNSTAVDKLKIWYRTCMDRDTIEQQGHDRLLEIMVELGFWTVSPPPQGQLPWNRDQWSLQDALVQTHKLFGSSLFDISIEKDPTEENENILMFTQDGLTLSYKDEYKDKSNNFKKAFIAFAVQVGTLLGGDAGNVSAKMEQVYEFEKNLSEIFVPREKLIDPLQIYKKFSLLQFQEMLGDWFNIKSYLKEIFYGREFSDDTDIIITTPAYFSQLGQVVNATDKETLANYVMWDIVQSMLEYLPDDFKQASLLLTQAESGVSSLPERWIRCLHEARSAVGFASSALFVENYFSPQSKTKVDNVLEQVKLQFISNLDFVDWLDEVTRLRLVDKAKAVSSLVGYPDWILQAEKLDHRYEKLTVREGDLFNNNLNLVSYLFNRTLEKYDKKPDPEEWHFFPDIVNAFYNPLYNHIVMPAGILQPPVYSPDYPDVLLYGTIGTIIGHELTHAFDNSGRVYDQSGLLKNMWTRHAENGFKEATVCMANQYSDYAINDHHLNGNTTLGENIADNGGFKLSYRAFEAAGKPSTARLPGLNYTDNQLFFIGFSQLWCSIETPEHVLLAINTDPHSTPVFRVRGVLSNSQEFSDSFNCKAGSPMNPEDKCKVW